MSTQTRECEVCQAPATHLRRCDKHHRCDECGGSAEDLCFYVEGLLCGSCRADMISGRIAKFAGNTEWTPEPICPWCGCTVSDAWDLADADEWECSDCENRFTIQRHVYVEYSTAKPNSGG